MDFIAGHFELLGLAPLLALLGVAAAMRMLPVANPIEEEE